MARLFNNDGTYIAQALLEHINGWAKKPCAVKLEELSEKPPAMALQPLQRAEVVRKYMDGSYIGVFAFSVYIRVNANDTATRLDAAGVLNALADWISERDETTREYKRLPTIDAKTAARSIEMTATPSISTRYDNGFEDYQAIFELQYHKRR